MFCITLSILIGYKLVSDLHEIDSMKHDLKSVIREHEDLKSRFEQKVSFDNIKLIEFGDTSLRPTHEFPKNFENFVQLNLDSESSLEKVVYRYQDGWCLKAF